VSSTSSNNTKETETGNFQNKASTGRKAGTNEPQATKGDHTTGLVFFSSLKIKTLRTSHRDPKGVKTRREVRLGPFFFSESGAGKSAAVSPNGRKGRDAVL